jgi:hypothetical protein
VIIQNAVEIRRSAEDVFDYCTDLSREPEWNPKTRRIEQVTGGPIGLGTRYEGEWVKGDAHGGLGGSGNNTGAAGGGGGAGSTMTDNSLLTGVTIATAGTTGNGTVTLDWLSS